MALPNKDTEQGAQIQPDAWPSNHLLAWRKMAED